ncbi:MAG: rhomboid family intramembrane serine protease [Tahibacter sp.]
MPLSLNILIIGVTCLVSFVAFNNRRLIDQLILWPPAINHHREYYRLVSYGLIHADGMHLLFNMMTLYFFGRVIEPLIVGHLGAIGYIAFYIGALIASILPTYAQNKDNPEYRSLGASGAVSAVLFAYILIQPWSRIYLYGAIGVPAIIYAALYIGYSIYMDRARKDNVNHSAHLWGAAYGIAFLLVMEPSVLSVFLTRLGNPN